MTSNGTETPKKPTLKTIAQMTGLAVPTVSRALGGAEDISKATRARVRQVADDIGYVPNRAGVRLRTGRTNVISLVLSTEHESMNHTAKLISSVAGGLRDTAFHLNITPYFADEDPLRPVRYIVENGSADAVILNQIRPDDPRVSYLLEKGFPFVTHGRTQWSDQHPYYDFDNLAFGKLAIADLAARGRRSILMVAPPADQNYAQEMITGAKQAAAELDVSFAVLEGATSNDFPETIEAAVSAHLDAHRTVDGIICASSDSSLSVMVVVEERGMVIGETVDIFSKDTTAVLTRIRNKFRTISEDVGQAGDFLARAAMRRIAAPDAAHMQQLERPAECRAGVSGRHKADSAIQGQ